MKPNRLITASLAIAAILLLSSCAPDMTSPVLKSEGDLTGSVLQNGSEKPESSHVRGVIAEIDYDAMQLRVGDDWFWADEQTKIKIDDFDGTPSYSDLEIDDVVKIEYRTPADEGKGFYAEEIKAEGEEHDDDDESGEGQYYDWAQGYVTEVDSDGMRFQIGEMWFWADEQTSYCDDDDDDEMCWSFDDIQVGVWLKARYHTTADEEKGYYARLVLIKPNHEFEWAKGYVDEVDVANTRFRIGEMWFWGDEHTSYCDDDDDGDDEDDAEMCRSFDDIQVGVWVKTKYRTFLIEDVGYYAMKVIVKFEQAKIEGTVDEIDGDGMRLRIGADWYWSDEHTKIEIDGLDGDPTFADIGTGDLVKIKYLTPAYEGKGLYAKEIEVKESA